MGRATRRAGGFYTRPYNRAAAPAAREAIRQVRRAAPAGNMPVSDRKHYASPRGIMGFMGLMRGGKRIVITTK